MWDAVLNYLVNNDEPISAHYVHAVMFVLWLPLLAVRMPLVDRRDALTALDYIAYGVSSGVVMLWGITAILPVKCTDHGFSGHVLWFVSLVVLTVANFFRVKTDSEALKRRRMADAAKN